MARLSPVLRSLEGTDGQYLTFWCPGCESPHQVRVRDESGQRPSWTYNGKPAAPTFQPSILVTSSSPRSDYCCHSFVTDGQIQFLDDCHHELKGKTVPLPDWDKAWGGTEGE